jgi:FkbM family methyltransferase
VPHGTVLAIEPAPMVYSVLKRNVAESGCQNITVVSAAVGDKDGTVRFKDISAWGHISECGVEVPIRTLASLVTEHRLPRLDFVKIDVEGYEYPILQNSLDLLNHHQSLVLVEFNALTQMVHADVNPRRFAEWLFGNFSHVFRLRRDVGEDGNYLERLPADGAMALLYTNLVVDAAVSDLLVTNFAGRLAGAPNRLRSELTTAIAARDMALAERDAAIAARDMALAERDGALTAGDTKRAERDAALIERDATRVNHLAAIAERDAAQAQRDALLSSTSWHVTAPLRVVGSLIGRSR